MKRNGFTLIELMIVIAIVAILISLVVPVVRDKGKTFEIRTICNHENTEVFNEVTKGTPKPIGDGYWEVDGQIIFAGACTSKRNESTAIVIE